MTDTTFDQAQLAQYTGTERWYRHALARSILFTDGAKYVADSAGAYWLLDEIALAQRGVKAVAAEPFQVWRLTVKPGATATLACGDGNDTVVYSKAIAFTDFPACGVTLWFTDGVILLPSEY